MKWCSPPALTTVQHKFYEKEIKFNSEKQRRRKFKRKERPNPGGICFELVSLGTDSVIIVNRRILLNTEEGKSYRDEEVTMYL